MVIVTCLLLLMIYINIGKEDQSLAKRNVNNYVIIEEEKPIWGYGWVHWEDLRLYQNREMI